ncbi:MAG: hypothetical protein VR73_14000 [Gammaproteobacteria bacterium BRH_c0]|nr:MAG: hypothetical protein VR73_14000 [Gammaproteobacteria bacterium BRH_c0]
MLIDSHCHLDRIDLLRAGKTLDEVLDAARARGVGGFLTVGIDLESSRQLIELAQGYRDVYVSAGAHPLQESTIPVPDVAQLVALGQSDLVVAIGETGLDNHYSAETADWQIESFINHLIAARELAKPVIVHTRQAQDETLRLLRQYACPQRGGVLHCFTESWEMAQAAIDLNFYISFSGIITFRNAAALREVVRQVPLERLLVETDSPWLAPMPHRGKQNEPQYVVEVARQVAELKGLSVAELAAVTSANFRRLFQLPEAVAS